MLKIKNLSEIYFFGLLGLFIIGGLGWEKIWVSWYGLVFSSFFCWLFFTVTKKIVFPDNFKFYIIFLLIFSASLLWSSNFYKSFSYLLMFSVGGFLYLNTFNLKLKSPDINKRIVTAIICAGVFFAAEFIYIKYFGTERIGSFGLINYASGNYNHHHIGDYWILIIIISIYSLLPGKKIISYWLVLLTGSVILAFSSSRSAYVALITGIYFLIRKMKIEKKNLILPVAIAAFTLLFFLKVSTVKSLIFSRQYFFQALAGVVRYPLGVGVGNFDVISKDPALQIFNLHEYSSVTHNILLEFITGLGILGITFAVWLLRILQVAISNKRSVLASTLFLTLTVNFLFDFTYFIPSMLWIWFTLSGLVDGNNNKNF